MAADAQPAAGTLRGSRRSRLGRLTTLLIVAALPLLTLPGEAGAAAAVTVDRIWGADRYETSLAVATRFVNESGGRVDTAVVVPGTDWRDAVIAAGVAGALNAPVMLSPPRGLSAPALRVLEDAAVSRVVVIDGAGSLRASALDPLRERFADVDRLSGADPSALSAEAARRTGAAGALPTLGRTAILASADVFVDAMVAGPVAWRGRHSVLLTSPDTLDAAVKSALAQLDVDHVIVMGGTSAVSKSVVDELIAAQISVTRVGGTTRFDTAQALAGFVEGAYASGASGSCFDPQAAGIATARSPFDALSAAPLLGRRCSPLLLSEVSAADPSTVSWVRARVRSMTVFGGTAAVSEAAVGVLASEAPLYQSVATGAEHTCALTVGGSIACWGDNSSGQLHAPDGAFTAIAAGAHHSCALRRRDGTAVCWGDNSSGQLDAPDGAFTAVAAGGVLQQGSAMAGFSCALRSTNSAAVCWGDDRFGQVSGVPDGAMSAIAAGWVHACGLRSGGTVACWGFDGRGQVSKAPSGRFSAVAAGAWHTCALRRSDGAVVCWGATGTADPPAGSFAAIAAGADVTCGLRSTDRRVACWGFDGLNQVSEAPPGAFGSVTSSAWHVCAVRDDRQIVCWGDNSQDQSTVPVVLPTG